MTINIINFMFSLVILQFCVCIYICMYTQNSSMNGETLDDSIITTSGTYLIVYDGSNDS